MLFWDTTGNPSISDNYTEEGVPIAGDFTSEITGLTDNQIYYVKAYVTTDTETIYGNEVSFTTLIESEIEIITNDVTNITTTSASGNGNITITGSPSLIQHGICWNTTGNPSISDNYTEEGVPISGDFTSEITGLTDNQIYYVKAYVTTDTETIYGNEVSFATLNVGVNNVVENQILIYPNPSNGIFAINTGQLTINSLSITNLLGKQILEKTDLKQNKTIDLSGFENRIYLIRIHTNKKIFSTKIIKQ